MTIPERQLETWTHQGNTKGSRDTYAKIKRACNSERSALSQFDHEYRVHLQGSYRNNTNIYADSDVDVVVKLTNPYWEDLTELSAEEEEKYWNVHTESRYYPQDFHSDVYKSLYRYFDLSSVTRDDIAIKVDYDTLPVDADVVACVEYRRYHSFPNKQDAKCTIGMLFHHQRTNRIIINFSEIHHENGIEKNKKADKNYKETIRVFKNARNRLITEDLLAEGVAPSYFIECLLFNVPNDYFAANSLSDRYDNIVDFLERGDISQFEEQCEIYDLFVADDPDRWNREDGHQFIKQLRYLWDNWDSI